MSNEPHTVRTIVLALVLAAGISAAVVAAPNSVMLPPRDTVTPNASHQPGLRLPEGARVLVVGDSFALGVGASDQNKRWPNLLAKAEGWDVTVDAVGSTGFISGGGSMGTNHNDYASRLASLARAQAYQPDLVILEGGQNDVAASNEQLTRAVTITVRMVQAVWPSAQVIVLGPSPPEPLATQLDRLNDCVERGATLAGVYSVNPRRTAWFTSTNSQSTNYKGSHVNDAGHALIAARMEEAMKHFAQGGRQF